MVEEFLWKYQTQDDQLWFEGIWTIFLCLIRAFLMYPFFDLMLRANDDCNWEIKIKLKMVILLTVIFNGKSRLLCLWLEASRNIFCLLKMCCGRLTSTDSSLSNHNNVVVATAFCLSCNASIWFCFKFQISLPLWSYQKVA